MAELSETVNHFYPFLPSVMLGAIDGQSFTEMEPQTLTAAECTFC